MPKSQPKQNGAAAKPAIRSKQTRAFRDLLAAEEILQTTIESLVLLGACEFTAGLCEERHRLLARLETLQSDVYVAYANSNATGVRRVQ
jgi:hypothetical protein